MAANIRNRADLAIEFEDGHALAVHRNNGRTFFRDAVDRYGIDEAIRTGF